MKQVWILNHYAQVPGGVGGTRHHALAQELAKHGWAASIVAASTDYSTGAQRLPASKPLRLEMHDGVPFLFVRCPDYVGNGAGRMRNMLAYCFAVLRRDTLSRLPSPDVIVGSSVHPFAALAAAILAVRYRVPFVFEVRDLWPQTLIDMGRLKANGFVAWGMRLLERWLYHRASRIVVLLPQANEYIEPLGVPPQKIVWIPNGVDLSAFPRPPSPCDRGVFTLMYLGAHGQANGLDTLMQAMKLIRQHQVMRPVRLRLIGDGTSKPELVQLAAELGLDGDVTFEAAVAKREIPALAAEADGFVICVRDLPNLYRYGISMNKLFDYLAGARPVLIASAASNNPVAEAGAGLTVRPDDPEALAAGIANLVNMPPNARSRMGAAGREYVEAHHGFDRLGAALAQVLDKAVAERDGGA